MRYFYDRASDSLYLTLSERSSYRDSVEAAPGVVLDFDNAGRLVGIDLERASRIVDVADLELHEEPSRADAEGARLDGAGLRKERERIGLSQVELARKLSVSPNTVARWERGELKIEHAGMLQLALRSLRNQAGSRFNRAAESPRKRAAAYTKEIERTTTSKAARAESSGKTPRREATLRKKSKRGLTSR